MATTLQKLLDDLVANAVAASPAAPIEDISGALGHLGRGFTRLAHDGLTAVGGLRERTAADLGEACVAAGRLWPATGGPLTDLAGAAADVVGRDRVLMGRSHRWAVTVELAGVADEYARLGHRLLPQAAVAELTAVRRLAAVVERDAQTDPPTVAGFVMLDRLLPVSGVPRGATNISAADASAALTAALDRAQRTRELTLREFRAALAAAEINSRSAAMVTAARTGSDPEPLLVAAAAWQFTGRMSMALEDGRRATPTDPRGVIPWARTLADVLRADIGSPPDITALRKREDLGDVAIKSQQVVNQLPLLGEQLAVAVASWARTGQLYGYARDLPAMDEMPEDRIRDVIAGRRVQARGSDLDVLGHAARRAIELSTALADTLNRTGPTGASRQGHLAEGYAQLVRAPGAAERLLSHAQAVTEDLAAARATLTASPAYGREHMHRPKSDAHMGRQ